MTINQIIKKAVYNPKKLFLLDGLGAILSAFLLGVVLVKFERFFGMPPSTLYFLASLPILFAVYDFYCYKKKHENSGKYLQGIAVINLLYCCLSVGLAFYHSKLLTAIGWINILIEILIVIVLAAIELKVAKNLLARNRI